VEAIAALGGILLLALGLLITGRTISMEFLTDQSPVRITKVLTLLAYVAGLGALFVGRLVFGVIAVALSA
jgi:hypothetical protein